MYTGQCLCGGVQFRIDGELAPIQVCHCSQCRRAQGTPFATNIPVATAAFTLLTGRELLREYASSPGKLRVFCGRCGSPIYSARSSAPETVRIRAGVITEPLQTRPGFHFHTDSRCSWWPINDGLPQYPAAAPPPRG